MLTVSSLSAQVITNSVKVNTKEGTVVGYKAEDGDYFAFYGVPYGGSSSGEYRFKAAAPPPSRDKELIANKTDILCAQPGPEGLIGVEDCLTLNIFAKSVDNVAPVIVWLSGEGFSNTYYTKNYSYRNFTESDIVFVQVNYRLSIFGFLCLGVEDAPGNAGLKDVLQALMWIQSNIKNFGGNPENIILLGHGSGAAMVDLITLSKQNADLNLVHKAIVIGGSALSPWAISYNPREYARSLTANLGLREVDDSVIAKSLKSVPPENLVSEINTFVFTNQTLLFAPCVENTNLKGWILDNAPINLLKLKSYKAIPYIAGFVNNEGTMIIKEALDHKWLERMETNFTDFLPVDLSFGTEATKNNISQYIRQSYFGNNGITNASIEAFLEYEGDTLIKYPVIRNIKERVKASNNSIRLFTFDLQDDANTRIYGNLSIRGVDHRSILNYIFDIKGHNGSKNVLVKRFIAFAKTG
ncbi:hypothetical protein evm_003946, partial [Chilo suppressalis]